MEFYIFLLNNEGAEIVLNFEFSGYVTGCYVYRVVGRISENLDISKPRYFEIRKPQ